MKINLPRFKAKTESLRLFFLGKLNAFKFWFYNLKFVQKFLIGVGIFLLIAGPITFIGLKVIRGRSEAFVSPIGSSPGPTQDSSQLPPPKPVLDHESPLNGVMITKEEYEELQKRLVLAVNIDNLVSARPQSGLEKADLVYEALVEGGITRFLAVYLQGEAPEIGPIRSARSYFIDLVSELDSLYMHIGGAGSPNQEADALGQIVSFGIKSLNRGGTYWRVKERPSPHNAYSSTERLWKAAENLGWNGPSSFEEWKFKKEMSADLRRKESFVELKFGSAADSNYAVKWVYDQARNIYLRFSGGVEHKEKTSGAQLFAKNVVLQFVSERMANDGTLRIILGMKGEGEALIFQDGRAIEGSWKKENRVSRTKFYDSQGQEAMFNRGQIWIEVLPVGSSITYN